jgi:hypothetical protein
VVALAVWSLAVGVVRLIGSGADALGADWLVTTPAGVLVTGLVGLVLAGSVVFAAFTYWYYRGGPLGVTHATEE